LGISISHGVPSTRSALTISNLGHQHGGAAHVDQTAHITAIAIAALGVAAG
jgi:hypothetical protein